MNSPGRPPTTLDPLAQAFGGRVKHALKLAVLLLISSAPVFAQAPTPGAGRAGTGIHFVYLVRHGIYDLDTTVTDDRVGNALNTVGHDQARLVGERLAGLGLKFDRLISSQFLRAAQTADDMGKAMMMTPTRDSVLNECTSTNASARIMAREKAEDIAACDAARETGWSRYFTPTPDRDTYDVLVCHGNVIRWTWMKALGADVKNWINLDCGNASITIISVRPDGSIRPVMYSDVGHIPVAKQTWSGRGGGWVKGR
jgi:serine/threonine-protein phosphatase PGAM5